MLMSAATSVPFKSEPKGPRTSSVFRDGPRTPRLTTSRGCCTVGGGKASFNIAKVIKTVQ